MIAAEAVDLKTGPEEGRVLFLVVGFSLEGIARGMPRQTRDVDPMLG